MTTISRDKTTNGGKIPTLPVLQTFYRCTLYVLSSCRYSVYVYRPHHMRILSSCRVPSQTYSLLRTREEKEDEESKTNKTF